MNVSNIEKRQVGSIRFLLELSMFAILVDIIVGLHGFITETDNWGFILKIILVLKLLIIIPLAVRKINYVSCNPLLLVLLVFATFNISRALLNVDNIGALISGGFFYCLIMAGATAGYAWSSLTYRNINIFLSDWLIFSISIAAFLLCSVYFVLYKLNVINYFGLGTQAYIITAIIISHNKLPLLPVPILTILLTGKRGVFLVILLQCTLVYLRSESKTSMRKFILLLMGLVVAMVIAYDLGVLARFEPLLNLSFSDVLFPEEMGATNKLYLATSGRSSEVFAFLGSISPQDLGFWVGYPTDYSFSLLDVTADEYYNHHYTHISPFNYLKHFGVPVGIYLFFLQCRVAFFAIKHAGRSKDLGLILYVGYFFAMFFGAIVLVDILFWISFFYSYFRLIRFPLV